MRPSCRVLTVWIFFAGAAVVLGVVGKKLNRSKHPPSKWKELGLEFTGPMRNVTVAVGKDAEFTCKVNQLKNNGLQLQLVWIKLDTQTILAIEKQLVQNNPRISVSQYDGQEFTLRIRNTQPEDAGVYACRINTKPFSQMKVYLDIQVSPAIIAADSTDNILVQEGVDVVLKCKATGKPTPKIYWTREDRGLIHAKGHEKTHQYKGMTLHIPKIGRQDMADYICTVSNGVPPDVTQKIIVRTKFPPTVWAEPKTIKGWSGGAFELKCEVEAYPEAMIYWIRDENVLKTSMKHEIRSQRIGSSNYRVKLTLIIKDVDENDYGEYICRASNALGTIEDTATLYESEPPKRGSMLRDHSAIYDGHQMDQNSAWTSEVASSRRKNRAISNYPSRFCLTGALAGLLFVFSRLLTTAWLT